MVILLNSLGSKLNFQRNLTVKGYRKPQNSGKRNTVNHMKVYITGKLTKDL